MRKLTRIEKDGPHTNNFGGPAALLMEKGPSRKTALQNAFDATGSLGSTQLGLRRMLPPEEMQATLRLYNPVARKVFVAGTFNDWRVDATPLKNVGNGEWILSLMLKPGTYEYRFVADGQWCNDLQVTDLAKNPYGGWNSVLRVGPRTIRLPVLPLRDDLVKDLATDRCVA